MMAPGASAVDPPSSPPLRLNRPVAALFVLGLFVRLVLALFVGVLPVELWEPVLIALSLLHHGAYADAFGPGVGPTAHTMPLHPILLAGVISLFGLGIPAKLATTLLASSASALAFALLPRLAVNLGLELEAGLLAGLLGELLPLNFWPQTSGIFDAPFTALAIVILSCQVARCWRAREWSTRTAITAGLTAGVTCLLNALVLALLAGWMSFGLLWSQSRIKEFARFWLIVGLIVAACLAPWAYRNHRVLHHWIWTRSNLGLELQVSNNSLVTAELEKNVRSEAWASQHPHRTESERERVRLMGEPAYNEAKKQQALAWIRTHPWEFARLTAERVFLFWFPRMKRIIQTIPEALVTAAGLLGLWLLIRRRHPSTSFFLAVLLSYPLAFYIIQTGPRYRLAIEPLIWLLAGHSGVLLLARRPGGGAVAMHLPLLKWLTLYNQKYRRLNG